MKFSKINNKKGNVSLTYYLLRVVIVVVLMGVLMMEIGFFTNINFDTQQLEQKLIAERILNGPQGIAHTNSLGQKEIGTVDIKELQSSNLNKVFAEGKSANIDETLYGARVSLYLTYEDALNFKNKKTDFAFINPEVVKTYLSLGRAGVLGPGSSNYYIRISPRKIYYGETQTEPELGYVVVEVIRRT